MKLYPLVFSFRDVIAGHGFFAVVSMEGRALLTEEDDGDTWIYGVQPGGVAGGDPKRDSAFDEFKKNYLSVLYDLANDAGSFKEFEATVTAFFHDISESVAEDWDKALADVRKNNI